MTDSIDEAPQLGEIAAFPPSRSTPTGSMTKEGPGLMDENKMMAFVGQAVGDVGAMLGGAMAVIGDKLGLYRG